MLNSSLPFDVMSHVSRADIDISQMYQEMVWASDGYLHIAFMQGEINIDKIKSDIENLIFIWEKVYRKSI